MKNIKLKFIGNTLLVFFMYVTMYMGISILVDMMVFGEVSWTREDILDDLGSSLFMSIFFFIMFDGSNWLKRRRELFNPPMAEQSDIQQ